VSGYGKDDFTAPVEDYDFTATGDVRSLIDQMGRAGGFTATKLAHARDVLRDSIAKSDQDGVLNWLSFPACLCATGTRGFFLEALKRKSFNVVITTCGTLDHDIARTYQDYFHGDFRLDDIALAEEGLNRLGNVIIPNECYGEILEQVVLPWLQEIEAERREADPDNPWLGFGSVELCWAMGDRIDDESSLLHWAAKHRVPIVIPGLSDGSIGSQLFMHRQKSPDFMVDFLADEQILSDLTWTAEESHALMVGGGNLEASRHLVEPVPRGPRLSGWHHDCGRARRFTLRRSSARGDIVGKGAPGGASGRGRGRCERTASYSRRGFIPRLVRENATNAGQTHKSVRQGARLHVR